VKFRCTYMERHSCWCKSFYLFKLHKRFPCELAQSLPMHRVHRAWMWMQSIGKYQCKNHVLLYPLIGRSFVRGCACVSFCADGVISLFYVCMRACVRVHQCVFFCTVPARLRMCSLYKFGMCVCTYRFTVDNGRLNVLQVMAYSPSSKHYHHGYYRLNPNFVEGGFHGSLSYFHMSSISGCNYEATTKFQDNHESTRLIYATG
jgi:hypothetical protein